jgi:membrane protease YdiL (CAAX protease family)
MATVLLPLSHLSSAFVPGIATAHDRGTLLLMALGAVGVGGLLEELGWTGFVVPRLLERRSVLVTGLIVGVLWQAWHFLVNLWFSSVASGPIAPWSFILPYFVVGIAQLTAFRVLMIWVYSRSKSLLLAVLMHGSLIASTAVPVLTPPAVGVDFLAWFLGVAVVLWVAVGIVAIACPGQLGAKRSLEGAARGSRLQAAGPLRRGTTNAVEPG